MSKTEKLLAAAQNNPRAVRFSDLVRLVEALGFVRDRQSGSHAVYVLPGHPEVRFLNLQEGKNGMAKTYQVGQVLELIEVHALEVS